MIHNKQPRRPNNQCPDQKSLKIAKISAFSQSISRVDQNEVGEYDREALEEDRAWGGVVEAPVEVGHGGVHSGGEEREEFLEVSEERRVIEGPLAGGVGVPSGEGEGVGEG